MFCQNCGGKLEPSAKFCVFCGAAVSVVKATPKAETKANHIAEKKDTIAEQKVEKKDSVKTAQEVIIEDAPEAEETQNELNTDSSSNLSMSSSKNKIIIVASTLLCIVVASVALIILGASPEAKMNRAIKNGNIKEGYTIYKEKLADEGLSEKTADALIKAMADFYKDYSNDKISQNEVYEKLMPMYDFAYSAEVLSEPTEESKRVQKKLDYYTFMLSMQIEIVDDDPLRAIQYYQQAIKMDETAEEAKRGLEQAEARYKELVLKNVEAYESSGDLDGATNALTDALVVLPNDTALTDLLKAIEGKKNEIIERQKSFEDTLDNGWDYLQTSMLCYGYDIMPDDFFKEGQIPAALEFTSEAKGVIGLVIPEVDLNYRASFVYSVSNNKVILRPDPNGLFPVESFNGVNFIYLDILPNGNLQLVEYAPNETEDLGFTTWNEIFTHQGQDEYTLSYSGNEVSENSDGSELNNGWDYMQSTLIGYDYDILPNDFFSEGITAPAIEFTSETEGFINLVLPYDAFNVSFTYSVDDDVVTLLPNPNGAYPDSSFAGKTVLKFRIKSNGDLELLEYAPADGSSIGFTDLGDVFSAQEIDDTVLASLSLDITTLNSINSTDLLSLSSPNVYASNLQLNIQNRVANSGWYLVKDGWIYGRGYTQTGRYQFMKCRVDGSDKTIIGPGGAPDHIYAIDDYIYYELSDLYRINANGGEPELIAENCENIQIVDNYIYYIDGSWLDGDTEYLYRCNLDGSNVVQLVDVPVWYAHVFADGIIYVESDIEGRESQTMICDLDGTNRTQLLDLQPIFIYYDGNKLYYGKPNAIWRCNLDGSEVEKIYSGNIFFDTVMTENHLYFVNVDDDYRLYRMNKDGSEVTCISEDVNIESVEIHGEQLCYTRNTAEWDNDGVYFCNLDGSNKWRFTP